MCADGFGQERYSFDVSRLPAEAAKVAEDFFERALGECRDNILSIAVVGSAATADFLPGLSDINSCMVLDRVSFAFMEALASIGRKFGKRGMRAPLLMTPEYIERSLDVFALEFLDFKLAHVVVYGGDFFEGLEFAREDVRLACEREMKGLLVTARRRYLGCLGKTAKLKDALLEMTNSVLPVLRGLLFLAGEETPVERAVLLEQVDKLGFPRAPLREALEIRERDGKRSYGEIQEVFEDFYNAIEAQSYKADRT